MTLFLRLANRLTNKNSQIRKLQIKLSASSFSRQQKFLQIFFINFFDYPPTSTGLRRNQNLLKHEANQ